MYYTSQKFVKRVMKEIYGIQLQIATLMVPSQASTRTGKNMFVSSSAEAVYSDDPQKGSISN